MSIVSPHEQKVAMQYGLTELEYIRKREAYCRSIGKGWEQLKMLNEEDIRTIQLTGQDPDHFLNTKLGLLAETISRDFME